MAVITEIYYIGDLNFSDVYEMERNDEPTPSVDVFSTDDVSYIELCELGEVLGLGSMDALMAKFEEAFVDEDAGCGALILPENLVQKIKNLSVYEIGDAARAWSQSEQFKHMLMPTTLPNPPKKQDLFSRLFKSKAPEPHSAQTENDGLKTWLIEYLFKLQTFLKTRNEPAYLFMSP